MKYINLVNSTQKTLVDNKDFKKLSQYRWRLDNHGYATRSIYTPISQKQTVLSMHREILKPKHKQVDHINHNRLDNRRSNLRICSLQDNIHNKSKQSNNTSGFMGVTKASKNKWKAFIHFNNSRIHLAQGEDREEMAYIRDQAAIQLFGEFANTNLEVL